MKHLIPKNYYVVRPSHFNVDSSDLYDVLKYKSVDGSHVETYQITYNIDNPEKNGCSCVGFAMRTMVGLRAEHKHFLLVRRWLHDKRGPLVAYSFQTGVNNGTQIIRIPLVPQFMAVGSPIDNTPAKHTQPDRSS